MPHRTPDVQTDTRTRRVEKETVGVQTDHSLPKGIRCPGTRVQSRKCSTSGKTGGTSDGPRPGGTSRVGKMQRSGPKKYPEAKFDVVDSLDATYVQRWNRYAKTGSDIFAVAATVRKKNHCRDQTLDVEKRIFDVDRRVDVNHESDAKNQRRLLPCAVASVSSCRTTDAERTGKSVLRTQEVAMPMNRLPVLCVRVAAVLRRTSALVEPLHATIPLLVLHSPSPLQPRVLRRSRLTTLGRPSPELTRQMPDRGQSLLAGG